MALASKEAFWKEHQDSLVRIRSQLSSHGGKNSPLYNRGTPLQGKKPRTSPNQSHPPYGKYRRSPSPYLPIVDNLPRSPPVRGNKFEVVPPVKPKQAFIRSKPDYDSWGEESDDEGDNNGGDHRRKHYKPRPYPQPSPVVFGAPFATYYPPPPRGAGFNKRSKDRKNPARTYKDIYHNRQARQSHKDLKKKRRRKFAPNPLPVFGGVMMPMVFPPVDANKYKYIYGEEESESEEEMEPIIYLTKFPQFADDFISGIVNELLEEEILPDTLIEALNEYDRWPYEHPLYLPTLYSCEDLMSDTVKEQVEDLVKESLSELADKYIDEQMLKHDPLDDFLSKLINDAVDMGLRTVVRESVLEMADQHLRDEHACKIFNDVFQEHLSDIMPEMIEDLSFELLAEEFLREEVIAPEVEEEAVVVAKEMLRYYDNKVTKRELREVAKRANGQLADSLLMEYLLSVISRQGKLWAQDDHANRYLDGMMLDIAMEQYFQVQKMRDKTLQNKPLRKLHEKAFIEVALDVCLQQLTATLDEDLADVDEFERGVTDRVIQPIPLATR